MMLTEDHNKQTKIDNHDPRGQALIAQLLNEPLTTLSTYLARVPVPLRCHEEFARDHGSQNNGTC